jgi:hypothetical protein
MGRESRVRAALRLRACAIQFALLLSVVSPAAFADALDDWLAAGASCVQTLAGFNEERPWLQLRFEEDAVTVLVESGGRDNVLVALRCAGGGLSEGETYQVPQALSGGADLPDVRLPRDAYTREALAALVETGRRLTGARAQAPSSLVITSVAEPRATVLATVTFGEPTFRTVTFDPAGREVADTVPPIDDWTSPPVENRPSLGIETPIRSTADVLGWLVGALGTTAPVHRFIIDQGMVTIAYDDAQGRFVLQQWTVDAGNLRSSDAPQPIDAQLAQLYVRCKQPPRVAELPGAFAKLKPRLGKRLDAALMLVLECRNDSRKAQWELLGGDGVVVEGQPLQQAMFPFERQ